MNTCAICLRPSAEGLHGACVQALFGDVVSLRLGMSAPEAIEVSRRMADKLSIAGVQPKFMLAIDPASGRLVPVERGGTHILKPLPRPAPVPHLAANEHVTMRMAEAAGIEVPPCGLLALDDGDLAYVVRRFDRVPGERVHVEDFCQLLGWHPRDKFKGGDGKCVALIEAHSAEPARDLAEFYRRMVFFWWACCADMHLCNFSLLHLGEPPCGSGQRRGRLAPAYDIACTSFYAPNPHDRTHELRRLSIPIFGRARNLTPETWEQFGARCHLDRAAQVRIIEEVVGSFETAVELIGASRLPPEYQAHYLDVLRERGRSFLRR